MGANPSEKRQNEPTEEDSTGQIRAHPGFRFSSGVLTRRFPVFVAVAAFVLYAGTMGYELTLYNLPLASKLAGWDSAPMVGQPLTWLFTLPVRLFPVAWTTFMVKLLSAVVAATILGLLTRTIQLLSWDHPWDDVALLVRVIPWLTGVVICGLEFNYWLEATSTPGELLELLCMTAAAWLLLEYRRDWKLPWVRAAALVWGFGMTQNWLMMITLPLFVLAVAGIEKLRFFNWRHVLQLGGLGLAGFSVYALLPLVNGLAPHPALTFWESWHASFHQTIHVFAVLYFRFFLGHKIWIMLVTVYFLLPTLPLLIHMPDEGTQNKSGIDQFQIWLYRCLRAAVLLACCWIAFDPAMGARQILEHEVGIRFSLLILDYLTALGSAFLIGNLLLASQQNPRDIWRPSRQSPWQRLTPPLSTTLLVLITAGLFVRNCPTICRINFQPLEQFGETAIQSLPPGGGIVLSDFPERSIAFQAALARHYLGGKWLTVETPFLPDPGYRKRLERLQPDGWVAAGYQHALSGNETVRLLMQVARTNRLFYLHPSYGNFFEGFYLEPAGAIHEMKLRGRPPLDPPPPAAAVLDTNELVFASLWNHRLAGLVPSSQRNLLERTVARLGIRPPANSQDRILADWYSVTLDGWGVVLQKQGRVSAARSCFQEALILNTNNVSARVNLACNTNLQAGSPIALGDVGKLAEQLGNPDRIEVVINNFGPVDEPTFSYILGSVFLAHGFLFQAAEQMERVHALTPDVFASTLALTEIYNRLQMPERSRPLIRQMHQELLRLPDNSYFELNLALVESYAYLLQTNAPGARQVLAALVKKYPDDAQITSRVTTAYLALNDVTNALQLVDAELKKDPDDLSGLKAKAAALMQSGKTADAIPVMNRILAITNEPAIRLNRAFAAIATTNFPTARADLAELESNGFASAVVDLGLGMVAEHDADTNAARHYFELCLSNTPVDTPLWHQGGARLHRLESNTSVKNP